VLLVLSAWLWLCGAGACGVEGVNVAKSFLTGYPATYPPEARDGHGPSTLASCVHTPSPSCWKISTAQATLEATQGQIDSFFSQLPYKCYLEEVASVGD